MHQVLSIKLKEDHTIEKLSEQNNYQKEAIYKFQKAMTAMLMLLPRSCPHSILVEIFNHKE